MTSPNGSTTSGTGSEEIAFLGVVDRAQLVNELGTNLPKWNMLGLKSFVLVNLLPLGLAGFQFVFAIRRLLPEKQLTIVVIAPDGNEVGFMALGTQAVVAASDVPFRSDLVVPQWHEHGWSVFVVTLPVGIVLGQAGTYRFALVADHQDIGTLQVILVDPPVLTEERIAAIRSDPNAIKAVRTNIGCQKCASNLMVYAGLERMQSLEDEGYRWHQDIPDDFRCGCGSTKFDLRSMKKNLFAAIGQKMPLAMPDQSSFVPLYEHEAFEKVRAIFANFWTRAPTRR